MWHVDDGLLACGAAAGVRITKPQRKVSVMLIGNHSAGKSSFINWFAGVPIQKTGVAIETQGITFVAAAPARRTVEVCRQSLLFVCVEESSLMPRAQRAAVFRALPYFAPLADIDRMPASRATAGCDAHAQCADLVDYTTLETADKGLERFERVVFVDTPGLVDGHMGCGVAQRWATSCCSHAKLDPRYHFDVEATILKLSTLVDLVFVFFDPIGQALCARTLRVIEQLGKSCPKKLRFFVSKIDTVPLQADRQKVLLQIQQNMSHCFPHMHVDIPTIFIPDAIVSDEGTGVGDTRPVNQIDEAAAAIEGAARAHAQHVLDKLHDDIDRIDRELHRKLEEDERKKSERLTGIVSGVVSAIVLLSFVVAHGAWLLLSVWTPLFLPLLGAPAPTLLSSLSTFTSTLYGLVPSSVYLGVSLLGVVYGLLVIRAALQSTRYGGLDVGARQAISKRCEFVRARARPQAAAMDAEFFRDCGIHSQ
jgi:hypothetical protein